MLGQEPEFDGGKDRYRGADNHMHCHRAGSLETQYPRRNQGPQSYDEVQPFLPDGECRQCRDREHGDGEAGEIRVLGGYSGIEPENPGRKEQNPLFIRLAMRTAQPV